MQRHPLMANACHHVSAPLCCLLFSPHRWAQNTRKALNYSTLPASVKRILQVDISSWGHRTHHDPLCCKTSRLTSINYKPICSYQPEYPSFLPALFAFLTVYVKPLFSIKSPINLKNVVADDFKAMHPGRCPHPVRCQSVSGDWPARRYIHSAPLCT